MVRIQLGGVWGRLQESGRDLYYPVFTSVLTQELHSISHLALKLQLAACCLEYGFAFPSQYQGAGA